MSIRRLPRPRIQRAFVRWFNENRTRFKVPVRLTKITAKGVELHFQNYPDCLSVLLTRCNLNVYVEWQGEDWDTLIGFDAYLSRTPDGYKCDFCVPDNGESATTFPSREALWQDHLFEPFMKWVNERLAPARWLRVSCTDGMGATWATLIRNESELSKPDRTLQFVQQLKRLDGQPAHDGGPEGVNHWLISLNSEAG